ncbi:MAG: STAS domain-containing protein [Oscillochloris sp.]|nr:STAS domain-containing protein [Oscillochloris sp.]
MQRAHSYDPRVTNQFNQFLRWTITAALILGIAEVSMGWIIDLPALRVVGYITMSVVVLFSTGLWLMSRIQVIQSVTLISISCFCLAIMYLLAMPDLLPVCCMFVIGAFGLPMLFSERRLFRIMVAMAFIVTILISALRLTPPIFPNTPATIAHVVNLASLPPICLIFSLLFSHIAENARASLVQTQAANQQLQQFKDQLEVQVEQRTADLSSALATVEAQATTQQKLLAEVAQQREAIRELSVPVLPVTHDTLVMPLIGALDTTRLMTIQSQALQSIEQSAARRLLIDVTGVPIIDTQVAQGLIMTINAVRLLGAEAVLIGIRPEVAQTIVGLGLDMRGIRTTNDLQTAIAQTRR